MKKRFAIALAALMLLGVLSACGSSSNYSAAYDAAYQEAAYAEPMEMYAEEYADSGYYWAESASTAAAQPSAPADMGDVKMIYTAYVEMESTEFDEAVQAIAQLTAECGGYFEASSMSDRGSSRSASYTVRVPAGQYRTFLDKAGDLCHITYQEESSEDVSETYYDVAGRLETQKTKLSRLRQLLAEASHMDDIIVLESEISETEEAIDRLSGNLRHYDALVAYSTITVSLREVKVLTEISEVQETFGSRLASAFRSGLRSFGDALADIAVALAYSWLWLVLIAAAVVAVLLATGKRRRERREARRNAPPPAVPSYTKPEESGEE